MSSDLILTPGGMKPRDKVHHVPPGHSVVLDGANARLVDPNRRVIADFGIVSPRLAEQLQRRATTADYPQLDRAAIDEERRPMLPAGVVPPTRLVPRARQTPADGQRSALRPLFRTHNFFAEPGHFGQRVVPAFAVDGWVAFTGWTNVSGQPISNFTATWVVPPPPRVAAGQTVFLFNGIQNSTMIYQPVLQWGPSAGGGGQRWSVASWYADGQNGQSFFSTLVDVNVGDRLTGVMRLTGRDAATGLCSYNCNFLNIADTDLVISNVPELTWANVTLECYGITDCGHYPATNQTSFTGITVQTGGAASGLAWGVNNAQTACGTHVNVVNGSANGGQVDIWYRPEGVFAWTFAGNTAGFGHGINDGRPFWIGDFTGDGRSDVLFYYPGDDNWWLGSHDGNVLSWSFAGNTAGFGHGIDDGRPFWTGRFSTAARDEVLFYYPGDDNWWLGTYANGTINWSFAGNTAGFGHGINDGRPFWIGDFDGDGRSEVLFYYPGDDNWWIGKHDGNQLVWRFGGNTAGFGHGINDGRPFWTGRFSQAGRDEILFYYPGDDNWWLGTYDGNQFVWSFAGNTAGFGHGIDDGRPFFVGDFDGDGRSNMLFYFPGDQNWWLATHAGPGGQFSWRFVGNTAGFGQIWDGRPFWTGRFSRSDRDEVLFYTPFDNNWWLGGFDGNQIGWTFASNTDGFGNGINDGRPFWIGAFSRPDWSEVLFYYPGDDNWWLETPAR